MKKKPAPNWYEDIADDDPDCCCIAGIPENVKLAHAYVPYQCYDKAFCPAEALSKGTLFPELWGVYPIP